MGAIGDRLVQMGWQVSTDQFELVQIAAEFADSDEWAMAGYSSAGSAVMRQSHEVRGDNTEPWPSLSQQRSDALLALLSGGGSNVTTEVVFHVQGDGASLDDGTPVSESAVIETLGGSFVRAIICNAEGQPVNASSRRRNPSTPQKRVVKARDRSCVDCGSPTNAVPPRRPLARLGPSAKPVTTV